MKIARSARPVGTTIRVSGRNTTSVGTQVFYKAALLDHQALNAEEARKAAELLKLDPAAVTVLIEPPEDRGANLKMPPPGSLIYRFYEIVQGYGPTLKALINEEFGDGIMSAIDFSIKAKKGEGCSGELAAPPQTP